MKDNQPLITVLMPVYNVEKFVEAAVHSIISQSYRKLQIIIIDDCSTDGTYNKILNLSRLDSRILLLKNNENLKIVKTLNKALNFAEGDYIARMDGDDICSIDRLEKQIKFLLDNPEYSLVGSSVRTIDEYDNVIGKQEMPNSWKKIQKTVKYSTPVLHIWLAKRELYTQLGGYREIPGAEDYDFILRMHSIGCKYTNLESFDYSVRLRAGNTNSTMGFKQRLMSNYVLKLFDKRKNNLEDNFSEKDLKKYMEKYSKYKNNYDISNLYLNYALRSKANHNYWKMFYYLVLSLSKSRFQFQYLLRRLFFKFFMKIY
ncbi:glycosyltransferase family 2 protein [Acinetobacter seifertii]|uniref:glycosyltransferase family 2 protein n=1 Tax=Acinetobacter seifertii TaxID=1530123 RepID=UPI003EE356C7